LFKGIPCLETQRTGGRGSNEEDREQAMMEKY